MPKNPCHCPNCKGALRDPKTIKAHIRKVEALLAAQKMWQDKNEDARRRALAAESDEESSGEMHRDDEGSADSAEPDSESEEDVQRPQKRCRTDDLYTQVSIS